MARWLVVGAAVLPAVLGCGREADPGPVEAAPIILVAVDGASPDVLEDLWGRGELPNLRRLADIGVYSPLKTAYRSWSPVVWTTVATGVGPETHGIDDFTVAGPEGSMPVTSGVRRVPALWNMLSGLGRRVVVLGWWATWPVEPIDGLMVSDRLVDEPRDSVHPPERLPEIEAELAGFPELEHLVGTDRGLVQDEVLARIAEREIAVAFDLFMVYQRRVDITSHTYWRYYRPYRFPPLPEEQLERHRDRIPDAYRQTDAWVGRLLAAGPPRANVLIVSDHGARADSMERVHVRIDAVRLLKRLGFLRMGDGGPRMEETLVLPQRAVNVGPRAPMRFALAGRDPGGRVVPEQRQEVLDRLERRLAGVTYESGSPVFALAEAKPAELAAGADFVFEILGDGASRTLLVDGQPTGELVRSIYVQSGTHGRFDDGILIAAGPDIDADAELEEPSVRGIAPTVLYGLGLPVAKDFLEEPYVELFTRVFRRRHPLGEIASWGSRKGEGALESEIDEELLDRLRTLGYID